MKIYKVVTTYYENEQKDITINQICEETSLYMIENRITISKLDAIVSKGAFNGMFASEQLIINLFRNKELRQSISITPYNGELRKNQLEGLKNHNGIYSL